MNQVIALFGPVTRKLMLWLILPSAPILVGAVLVMHRGVTPADPLPESNAFYTVVPRDMAITIVKEGELQAVKNREIKCEVDGRTTILTVIEEGSSVRKGDVLMTLDSSAIASRIEDLSLRLERMHADLTTALEMKQIQEHQNDANLEAAEVALKLAEISLKRYEQGVYPQQLANGRTELEMAQIRLKKAEEALMRTRVLYEKDFVTATVVRNDELLVTNAQNVKDRAETSFKLLTEYAHTTDLARLRNAVSQADQRLARTRRVNASNLSQQLATVRARERSLRYVTLRMERYQRQLEACTIKAPADGLVVYGTTGDRWAPSALQVGSSVRREQLLFRLPDPSAMKAVVPVQEAQAAGLHEGMYARVEVVGTDQPLDATLTKISILPDSGGRSFNPDLREYIVELTLAASLPELKPGMGLKAEIHTDALSAVPAVPLSAIHSAGTDNYIFVKTGDQVEARKVSVGRTTESFAELLGSSVQSGEQVLTLQLAQGSELLAKVRMGTSGQTAPDSSSAQPCVGDRVKEQAATVWPGNAG